MRLRVYLCATALYALLPFAISGAPVTHLRRVATRCLTPPARDLVSCSCFVSRAYGAPDPTLSALCTGVFGPRSSDAGCVASLRAHAPDLVALLRSVRSCARRMLSAAPHGDRYVEYVPALVWHGARNRARCKLRKATADIREATRKMMLGGENVRALLEANQQAMRETRAVTDAATDEILGGVVVSMSVHEDFVGRALDKVMMVQNAVSKQARKEHPMQNE